MVAWLVRYGMGEKHIMNVTKTASAFHVSRSTLSKMITGKKFDGGKQAKKMKAAGETTLSKGKAGKSSRVSRVRRQKSPKKRRRRSQNNRWCTEHDRHLYSEMGNHPDRTDKRKLYINGPKTVEKKKKKNFCSACYTVDIRCISKDRGIRREKGHDTKS